jgi:hypothetical protein
MADGPRRWKILEVVFTGQGPFFGGALLARLCLHLALKHDHGVHEGQGRSGPAS